MSNHIIETSIDIEAPAARVWSILTNFESLPQWNRFILLIEGLGHLGERLSVSLDNGGSVMKFRPVVVARRENTEFAWRGIVGASFLFTGEHRFQLDPLANGGTRFTQSEQFGGLLVPLLWKKLNTRTRQSFEEFNMALRERSLATA
jgi:hypothetical protein